MVSDSRSNGRPISDNAADGAQPVVPQIRSGRRRFRPAALALGVLLGVAVGLAGIVVVLIATRGEAVPPLTAEALAAAERLWGEQGPASYRMGIHVGGRQPGPVEIEVHDGRVTHMTRNGIVPSQERTWEYWTAPEQFETIRQDLESAGREGGFGAPSGTKTVLRARFDPHYGYPARYQRLVLGTDLNLDWEVTSFERLDTTDQRTAPATDP